MSDITEDLKKKIYFNPRKVNSIIESACVKHNINKETLIESFINKEEIHPVVYASLIEENIAKLDEDLADYMKTRLGAVKDSLLSKFSFGGMKQRVLGNQERRDLMTSLFNNWMKLSGSANIRPTSKNLSLYLVDLGVDPKIISAIIAKFKSSFPTVAAELPSNKLRDFFGATVELVQQLSLKAKADAVRLPKVTKPAQVKNVNTITPTAPTTTSVSVTQNDIEKYISKLDPEQRAQFVTKDILPTLSDKDVQNIVTTLLSKQK